MIPTQARSPGNRELLRMAGSVNRACLLATATAQTQANPAARDAIRRLCAYIDGNQDDGPDPGRWSRPTALTLIRRAQNLMDLDHQRGTIQEHRHHNLLKSLNELTLRLMELDSMPGSRRVLDAMVRGNVRR